MKSKIIYSLLEDSPFLLRYAWIQFHHLYVFYVRLRDPVYKPHIFLTQSGLATLSDQCVSNRNLEHPTNTIPINPIRWLLRKVAFLRGPKKSLGSVKLILNGVNLWIKVNTKHLYHHINDTVLPHPRFQENGNDVYSGLDLGIEQIEFNSYSKSIDLFEKDWVS
ncbi:MAG: hypothetical protein JJU34_20745 [Lunatimonas sp.]|uniref:hypothetical protein n=1 Tax=Lunatimonas sp. TaxID=2060141 RepID=UPI00263B56E8|nr:hypothetical protein [Lunatimonas sp.]MCC5939722.1 hypothetical protein [Lunatimonas sp.]